MGKTPKVELSIPIIPDMELAATQTSEVVADTCLSQEKSDEIKMALIEACINAFEHSKTEEGQVEINFSIDDNTLVIKVTDQGVGFDSNTVKIPKIEQKIKSDHKRGWGLQLIKELMDTVEFESTDEGTTVTMTKKK